MGWVGLKISIRSHFTLNRARTGLIPKVLGKLLDMTGLRWNRNRGMRCPPLLIEQVSNRKKPLSLLLPASIVADNALAHSTSLPSSMAKLGHNNKSNNLPSVLLLRPFPFIPSYQETFTNKFNPINPLSSSSTPHLLFLTTHAHSVRALVCSSLKPLTSDTLRCLPSLQLVVTTSTGIDHIDLEECRRRGITIANASTVLSEDVADLGVGLLLDVLRKVSASDRFVRGRLWPVKGAYPLVTKVGGKRVGIVGLGSIGSEIAKRLEAFGCVISYNSRKKKPHVSFLYYTNIQDLAANSDILVVCCELTNETYHIINKDVLSALGKDGVLINVGRGALVDEKELVRCLVEGEIGGAGLDVFENEPNVPRELFELDNVVLSPHKAVLTLESFSALHELVIANLEAFFSDKPLLSAVKYE